MYQAKKGCDLYASVSADPCAAHDTVTSGVQVFWHQLLQSFSGQSTADRRLRKCAADMQRDSKMETHLDDRQPEVLVPMNLTVV